MNKYVQLTQDERVLMSYLRWQGLPYAKIAEQLGRHRSTIYHEFKRNSCHHIARLRPRDEPVRDVAYPGAMPNSPPLTSP